jgi:hypothetical protein
MSFSYASKTGAVYSRSRRIEYGESYGAGDVVGCTSSQKYSTIITLLLLLSSTTASNMASRMGHGM